MIFVYTHLFTTTLLKTLVFIVSPKSLGAHLDSLAPPQLSTLILHRSSSFPFSVWNSLHLCYPTVNNVPNNLPFEAVPSLKVSLIIIAFGAFFPAS